MGEKLRMPAEAATPQAADRPKYLSRRESTGQVRSTWFADARKALGLTQEQMAERFGVPLRSLQRVEKRVSRQLDLYVRMRAELDERGTDSSGKIKIR